MKGLLGKARIKKEEGMKKYPTLMTIRGVGQVRVLICMGKIQSVFVVMKWKLFKVITCYL